MSTESMVTLIQEDLKTLTTKELATTFPSRKKYIFNAQKCPDARKTPLNVTEALKGLGNTGARKPKVCSRKGTSMHTISR